MVNKGEIRYFNPRSYKRSDCPLCMLSHLGSISIHAPTRGATSNLGLLATELKFQSTLLQEERLQ